MKKAYEKPFLVDLPVAASHLLLIVSDPRIPIDPEEPDPGEGGDEYGLAKESGFTFDDEESAWE